MITKEKIGNELFVWIWERGLKKLLYKRWIDKGYGVVMDRQPFTAKDTESFNQSITDKKYMKQITKSTTKSTTKENHFVSVENFPEVLNYMTSEVDRSIRLTSHLKNTLTKLFGKHNSTFKGEFFYYIWLLEFDSLTFQIATASRKGSNISLQVSEDDKDMSEICINFLSELNGLIKEYDEN